MPSHAMKGKAMKSQPITDKVMLEVCRENDVDDLLERVSYRGKDLFEISDKSGKTTSLFRDEVYKLRDLILNYKPAIEDDSPIELVEDAITKFAEFVYGGSGRSFYFIGEIMKEFKDLHKILYG